MKICQKCRYPNLNDSISCCKCNSFNLISDKKQSWFLNLLHVCDKHPMVCICIFIVIMLTVMCITDDSKDTTVSCPICNGTGYGHGVGHGSRGQFCTRCNGTGELIRYEIDASSSF